jgi:para-aminobenzoate synthetase component 1
MSLLGWLGYDIAWEIEELPRKKIDPLPFPVAFWYETECFAILDHAQQILWLAASDPSGLDELQEQLEETTKLGGKKEFFPCLPHLPHPSTPFGDKLARELSPIAILRENGMNLCTKLRHNFRL